jgi:hypothetical protein
MSRGSCLKDRKTESLQHASAVNFDIEAAVVEDSENATGNSPQHMETSNNSGNAPP